MKDTKSFLQVLAGVYQEPKREYVERLLRLGIKKLGNDGNFASTFQHPTLPNVAVKVFSDEDRAYKLYIEWVQEEAQYNPYTPRILYEHASMPSKENPHSYEDDKYYTLVFLEKLKPVTSSAVKKFIDSLPFTQGYMSEDSRKYLKTPYDLLREDWENLSTQKTDIGLAQLARFMARNGFGPYHQDLRTTNLMLRGSQLIFTDPLR